jgi:D-sedoheptulose 7-phosphate isomerase
MENYIQEFLNELNIKTSRVAWKEVVLATKFLQSAYESGANIYLIGNGGSSAIASHFANDLNKTTLGHKGEKKVRRFRAICLSDNTPVLTAWANDAGYEKIFSEQLKNFAKPHDVLVAISSSGNSPNIIEAVKTAKEMQMPVVGFIGFDGGKVASLADAKIYIPSVKYGIVESAHDAICHLITNDFEENIKEI